MLYINKIVIVRVIIIIIVKSCRLCFPPLAVFIKTPSCVVWVQIDRPQIELREGGK